MPEEWLLPIVMAIAVLVLGSFALGTQWNVRQGDRVMRWMREGMSLIGERTTYRWLGSSVIELKIAKALGAFRNTETLIVFEPRDIILLWGWSRWRGRRDLIIFRAQLQTAPGFEAEIFDPKGWTTHHTERDLKAKHWAKADLTAQPTLTAYHSAKGNAATLNQLTASATQLGGKLIRLSVHRDVPNLEIHWLLPDLKTKTASQVFSELQQIASDVMRG